MATLGLVPGATMGAVGVQELRLHFQSLLFNEPQDHFFSASFNTSTGVLVALEPSASFLRMNQFRRPLDDSFDLATTRTGPGPKYHSVLLKRGEDIPVLDLGTRNDGGVFQGKFLRANGGVLEGWNFNVGGWEIVEPNVTAVAVTSEWLVEFLTDGRIVERSSSSSTRELGRYSGLVSNAGLIANDWVWFYERRNEKSTGVLRFLDRRQGRVVEALNYPQCRLLLVEPPTAE